MVKIWIDITNSPHVLFFDPIIKKLRFLGHEILITALDSQQTIELLKMRNLDFEVIGKHYASKLSKAKGLLHRTMLLWKRLRKEKIALSVSHGSVYCTWASKLLRVKNIYIMDGDAAFWNIAPALRFADKIIISEHTSEKQYIKWGAKPSRIFKYPGLKEEIYLHNFKPNVLVLKELGLIKRKPIFVIRPEASEAAYIHKKNVAESAIENCLDVKDAQVVLIARYANQREYYKTKYPNLILPEHAVDGPSLLALADLVISAGGTMNREAVVLGTIVISIYQHELLSVDKWLISNNYLLHELQPTTENFSKVHLKKYVSKPHGIKKIIGGVLTCVE